MVGSINQPRGSAMPQWTTYASAAVKDAYRIASVCMAQQEGVPIDRMARYMTEVLRESGAINTTAQAMANEAQLMHSWSWYKVQAPHVFIPSGMSEFLTQASRDIDISCLKSEVILGLGDLLSYSNGSVLACIFLHFPKGEAPFSGPEDGCNNENGGSVAYTVTEPMGWDSGSKGSQVVVTANDGSWAVFNPTATYAHNKFSSSCIRLLIGLSLYLDAFPDALKQMQAPSKEWKNKQTLSLAVPADVREDIDHSVSPHYRRGHLRLLSSERYTKEKRGKAVFVKGCFVKGKAYEVVG